MIHDSILEILREDVKRAPSGRRAEQIAARMGKGYSTLMNELNGSIPGHKFGLLQLIPLMEVTNSTRALDFLCGTMGCVCIQLPKSGSGYPSTERDAIEAVRQFGDLMSAVGDALDDGSISAVEGKKIRAEGYEAIQAVMTLIQKVEYHEEVGQ